MKTVIVGGVAGGMSAATRLRRLDEQAEIVVVERGGHPSYANCGLPYYAGGVIAERDALLLQTPESLYERFALDVRVRSEVTAIDRSARVVHVHEITSGRYYTESFDHLVLAPGARPIVPEVPGVSRALTLRDIDDVDQLVATLDRHASSAVVVGGGFIGLEAAENLSHRGLSVSVVELADQVLSPLDPEMAAPVADELRSQGVRLELSNKITEIGADSVTLADGRSLPGGVVLLGIGVAPEAGLAREADLEIGPRGGVAVDTQMRTTDPEIFAIGDAAEKHDAVGETPTLIPLANPANRQGRLVADLIAGRCDQARRSLGTAVVGVFSRTAATVGWNEKRLRAAGRTYRAIHTHPVSHAGYYPGAEPMALKLLIDPDTDRILGAQAVGGAGVDKRIDVLATAMSGGLGASELADLELAYAPQYGAAKDPVNMLGYIADNLQHGTERILQWHELDEHQRAGATVVDVRSPAEYAQGAIPGAVNIPLDELRVRADELPNSELIVHCRVGQRGHAAARLLAQHGHTVANLDGGYLTWHTGTHTTAETSHEAA